ncbi:MAG: response regulator transcription factor [Flavobacteriaceae bacterium]|jgi:DNA-binding LytR/AlgR family response regulator|nr:response regulator transcription factor [Flavobacteriaceae bacterium]
MKHRYIIIDDDSKSVLKTRSVLDSFSDFVFCGSALNFDDGLNLILETLPDFVFLEINPQNQASGLSLSLISEIYRFLKEAPQIIALSHDDSSSLNALRYGVLDFLVKPISESDLRKTFFRYRKSRDLPAIKPDYEEFHITEKQLLHDNSLESTDNIVFSEFSEMIKNEFSAIKNTISELISGQLPTTSPSEIAEAVIEMVKEIIPKSADTDIKPLIEAVNKIAYIDRPTELSAESAKRNLICIKSYGDYRFLELEEIVFLKADNNSTDITMSNGEQITAFKTLKYFEETLPENFYRIHNSYMVNRDYISRIHTGNSLCFIKNAKVQLPFSKGYKENVEQIIHFLAGSDFKETEK